MPATFRTEAVVLRSIRYGEADRILHLYSRERGRIGAIAKGVRRVKTRFGGRLEPLFRVDLLLHEGRGELHTVTSADTVDAHPSLRERRDALERATQACDAVLRLLDSQEPNRAAYNLLCHELRLLDVEPAAATRAQADERLTPHVVPRAQALAFRLKLLLAAGFAPELAACASCGEREHLGAFSASAGGVVCPGCEAGSFALDRDAYSFLVMALGSPLTETPAASDRALGQADRAIAETLEHHAHIRLRRVAA